MKGMVRMEVIIFPFFEQVKPTFQFHDSIFDREIFTEN